MPRVPPEQCAPYGQATQQQTTHQHRRQVEPHQRHGDRGCEDDADDAPRLPVFVRFRDIRAAGIATSRQQLNRLIDEDGFPVGIMLSPNIRAWKIADVEAWLEKRPTERKGVPDRWERQRAGV